LFDILIAIERDPQHLVFQQRKHIGNLTPGENADSSSTASQISRGSVIPFATSTAHLWCSVVPGKSNEETGISDTLHVMSARTLCG
jgi:hypothetical protein